jgi:hypothetical protein
MTNEKLLSILMNNNIVFEKCELFNDFLQSLLHLVFDTYLGDELTDKEGQEGHFKWCWDKNVNNFKLEGILIGDYKTREYFKKFMFENYYLIDKSYDEEKLKNDLFNLSHYIFDIKKSKKEGDVNVLINVYKLLENSMKLNETIIN